MRVAAILVVLILSGCAAMKDQVTSALGSKYAGQSIENLVVQFGPPSNTFKMPSGGTSYVWEIANHTDLDVDKY